MNTYRIINTTERLEKRHPRYSTAVELNYVDEMQNKKINLHPNKDVYLKIDKPPISFYQLKIEGYIQIIDVTGMEFKTNLKNKKKGSTTKKKTTSRKPTTQTKKSTTTQTKKGATTQTKKRSTTTKTSSQEKSDVSGGVYTINESEEPEKNE